MTGHAHHTLTNTKQFKFVLLKRHISRIVFLKTVNQYLDTTTNLHCSLIETKQSNYGSKQCADLQAGTTKANVKPEMLRIDSGISSGTVHVLLDVTFYMPK
jgi:hypothetical protein